MKKVLLITCLITSKEKYDGERIKCSLLYDSIKKYADLDLINLSLNKFFSTIKIFVFSIFRRKKYDYLIISKDAHGANIIHKILKFTHFPFEKIVYFEIGPFLYDRILNRSINKNLFMKDKMIIVETESMKDELKSLGFNRIGVCSNFKPFYNVPFLRQVYPKKILNLVYLSRIEDMKGIYDLISALKIINTSDIKFKLDIYGRPQTNDDSKMMQKLTNENSFISYKGTLEIGSQESYILLSNYDLHIFPTKYREGFPGSLIDFFIAGVPTLSSSFARVKEILSNEDSIVFKQGDNGDLINKLIDIYNNQNKLCLLRENSFKKRAMYSVENFEKSLCDFLDNNFD